MSTYTIEGPSIASVVAGLHEDGETVTVTGIANGRDPKTTSRGQDWASFDLIGERTAVEMLVLPDVYAATADLLGPITEPSGRWRPPTVTVTGEVDLRLPQPVLIAQHIERTEATS